MHRLQTAEHMRNTHTLNLLKDYMWCGAFKALGVTQNVCRRSSSIVCVVFARLFVNHTAVNLSAHLARNRKTHHMTKRACVCLCYESNWVTSTPPPQTASATLSLALRLKLMRFQATHWATSQIILLAKTWGGKMNCTHSHTHTQTLTYSSMGQVQQRDATKNAIVDRDETKGV